MDNSSDNRGWVRWLFIIAAIATIVSCLVIFIPKVNGSSSTSSGNTSTSSSTSATNTPLASIPTVTPLPTETSSPTPPPPPPGTVLYSVQPSSGFNGWAVGGPWKIVNGNLVNDGTENDPMSILAPFQPSSGNYAVEMRVRMPNGQAGAFGLVGRIGTQQGNIVGYYCDTATNVGPFIIGSHIATLDYSAHNTSENVISDGTNWHIMRFELKDTDFRFYLDGSLLVALSDAKFLGSGQAGIRAGSEAFIEVQSFVIYQL